MIKAKIQAKNKTSNLSQEIKLLRSVVIGWVGQDAEGSYNPKFVEKVLNNSKEQPTSEFKNKNSFLKSLEEDV